jgi:hypothetical protein
MEKNSIRPGHRRRRPESRRNRWQAQERRAVARGLIESGEIMKKAGSRRGACFK